MFLNILLPVYNEERRITKGVDGTVGFLEKIGFDDYRITIEDNASKDRTEEIAKSFNGIDKVLVISRIFVM